MFWRKSNKKSSSHCYSYLKTVTNVSRSNVNSKKLKEPFRFAKIQHYFATASHPPSIGEVKRCTFVRTVASSPDMFGWGRRAAGPELGDDWVM